MVYGYIYSFSNIYDFFFFLILINVILQFWSVDPLTIYRPVIEQRIPGAFLTQDPMTIMKSGNYYPVPWMTGVVQNEGAVRAAAIVANKTLLADFNSKFTELLPKMVTFQTASLSHNELIVRKLKEHYLNNSSSFSDDNVQAFIDVCVVILH